MLIARVIFGLLLVAAVLSFAMYAGTGQTRWRSLGLRIVKWTLVAGLAFFAVLILERLVLMI
jgi:glycerol uptake facilitator-like aquaporin